VPASLSAPVRKLGIGAQDPRARRPFDRDSGPSRPAAADGGGWCPAGVGVRCSAWASRRSSERCSNPPSMIRWPSDGGVPHGAGRGRRHRTSGRHVSRRRGRQRLGGAAVQTSQLPRAPGDRPAVPVRLGGRVRRDRAEPPRSSRPPPRSSVRPSPPRRCWWSSRRGVACSSSGPLWLRRFDFGPVETGLAGVDLPVVAGVTTRVSNADEARPRLGRARLIRRGRRQYSRAAHRALTGIPGACRVQTLDVPGGFCVGLEP
jgi:hypothetical protein